MPTGRVLLDVRDVVKRYKRVNANDGVCLQVGEGEVFALLGPNGAGKTTLVRMVLGLAVPGAGSIHLDGVDVVARPSAARKLCSLQPQSSVALDGLTVSQAIELSARIRGASRKDGRARASFLIDALEIGEWGSVMSMRLSGGLQRLVTFAMAIAWPVRLAVLDEPTNDLDPMRRRLLWQQVRSLADAGTSVLVVTHNVLEAERTADRVALLRDGRVVASGTPSELKMTPTGAPYRLEVTPATGVPAFASSGVRVGERLVCEVPEARIDEALAWARVLRERGEVDEFWVGPSSLEDVYVRLASGA